MPIMPPREFIGRCIDAAKRSLKSELATHLSSNSFEVTIMILQTFPQPLQFELDTFEFTIEIMENNEMVLITAIMQEKNTAALYEATMAYSKINQSIVDHWLSSEFLLNDLTLLTLMTDNIISIMRSG